MSSLADTIAKAIGANDEHQQPSVWLSTGFPPLDKAISGSYDKGLPSGRIIEIFGPPSSGKTAIATNVMAAAQRAGGIAMFNDHERSFDSRLGAELGLDLTPGQWVFKTPETFEESISNSMRLASAVRSGKHIPTEAPIVIVFDSLASMVPKSKMAKDVDELNMNDNTALARATAAVFPALAQWCERHNILAIFLNQMRTKIGVMYGDPTTTPGGNSPEYYASVRIKLGRSQIVEGPEKLKVGQRIGAECVKNKVARPFQKAEWDFRFRTDGSGYFDVTGSLIDHLVDIGKLEKAGNYIVWKGGKFYKRPLVEKIEAEGAQGELVALLPSS